MDSTGNVAVVERAEEARWPNQMYEAPRGNSQNFNKNGGYSDWGATPFGEGRRRNMQGKNRHNNNRRNHHQAAWSTECGPAPQSPQWQPQPPPPAETSFNGFQDPQGPVAVNLEGLPYTLCRQNFLEAMLDQAGLADDIMGCVLGEDQDTGKAVIYLANLNAAYKCVQHFGGRRWDAAGTTVIAQVAEVKGQAPPAGSAPQPQARADLQPQGASIGRSRKVRGSKSGQEQLDMVPQALGCMPFPGMWIMPQPALPLIAVQDYRKGSDFTPEMAGGDSPQVAGSPSSRQVNWADITDEDEKENDLSDGVDNSTSAGSTCRNSQDSTGDRFFFGCDVDTDDGF